MAQPTKPVGPGSWATLIFLSFVWGGAFMSMAVALEGYGPFTVAAGRTGVGALALLSYVAITRPGDLRIATPSLVWFIVGMGVLNFALPFSLLTWGLLQVTSAFAGVTMGSSPIFVLVLATLFVPDEQIGPRRIAGVIVGFIGLMILILPGALDGTAEGGSLKARLACVAASLCYSVGAILIRRAPAIPPVVFTGYMLAAATLVLLPLALVLEGVPSIEPSRALGALLYAGLVPTGLAFLLRVVLIQSAGPIFMSLVAYIVPIWAVVLGVALLGERLAPNVYIGTLVILAGVGLTQLRLLRPSR